MRRAQNPGGMTHEAVTHVTLDGQVKDIMPQHAHTPRISTREMHHPGGEHLYEIFYWDRSLS
jgi:hypothetical protein